MAALPQPAVLQTTVTLGTVSHQLAGIPQRMLFQASSPTETSDNKRSAEGELKKDSPIKKVKRDMKEKYKDLKLRCLKNSQLLGMSHSPPEYINIETNDGVVSVAKSVLIEYSNMFGEMSELTKETKDIKVEYPKLVVQFVFDWMHGLDEIKNHSHDMKFIWNVMKFAFEFHISGLMSNINDHFDDIDDAMTYVAIFNLYDGKSYGKAIYDKTIRKVANKKRRMIRYGGCYDTFKSWQSLYLCCQHSKTQIANDTDYYKDIETKYCCQNLLTNPELKLKATDRPEKRYCCIHRDAKSQGTYKEEFDKCVAIDLSMGGSIPIKAHNDINHLVMTGYEG